MGRSKPATPTYSLYPYFLSLLSWDAGNAGEHNEQE
jgi:hypothetical protein